MPAAVAAAEVTAGVAGVEGVEAAGDVPGTDAVAYSAVAVAAEGKQPVPMLVGHPASLPVASEGVAAVLAVDMEVDRLLVEGEAVRQVVVASGQQLLGCRTVDWGCTRNSAGA